MLEALSKPERELYHNMIDKALPLRAEDAAASTDRSFDASVQDTVLNDKSFMT